MGIRNILARFGRCRGAAIPHRKSTAELATAAMPLPREIALPMRQHIGTPCEPAVRKGDHVDVGSLVGQAPLGISAAVFSGVSGIVKALQPVYYSTGATDTAVVIETDGAQTVAPGIAPPQFEGRDGFLEALGRSGIVGLGGAGFPAAAKLATANAGGIDTLLINAAECEPYLTTDYREMLEHADTVLHGIRQCLTSLDVPRAIICIERDKPRAVKHLRAMTADDPRVSVLVLPSAYPQGAERVLIHNATGRTVPRDKLPADVGVILSNVSTASEIGRFLRTGMPLVRRRVTVAGDAMARPQNVDVVIGTRVRDVLAYCGLAKEPRKIVVGGPLMGGAQIDLDYPLVRTDNGLLAFCEDAMERTRETACIRCGRCARSCPMRLSPADIKRAYDKQDTAQFERLMADLCLGCGTCSYVCPAKQPLAQTSELARDAARELLQKGA